MINQLVILQPINLCNLNCSYCYVPGRRDPTQMNEKILEASVKHIFNSPETVYSENVSVVWHAGEPLAVGMDYYEKAIDLIKRYNNSKKIGLSLQTNGTLINQAWCDFFKKHNFDIGISIDGPQFIHDKHRKDWKNKGSFERAMRGARIMKENNMDLHAISVLTSDGLDYPEEVYNFFKENKFSSFGFNIDEHENQNTASSFSTLSVDLIDRYKRYLSKLYDLWVQDHRSIEIREFNEVLGYITFKKHNSVNHVLTTESTAFSIITISKTGNITTFSPELAGGVSGNENEFVIGNVLEINSFDDLIENSNYKKQASSISQGIINCARSCEYFDLCGGGAPSNKYYEKGSFAATETNYCKLTKQLLIDVVLEKLSE